MQWLKKKKKGIETQTAEEQKAFSFYGMKVKKTFSKCASDNALCRVNLALSVFIINYSTGQ